MTAPPRQREIALSAAWHAGAFGSTFTTVTGEPVEIIHRGQWSHGLGPDFQDALVLFQERELRSGGIEIHLRDRSWKDHGHHLDPAYNSVVLHVVGQYEGSETRCSDGCIVPVIAVGPCETLPLPDLATWDWDRVGGQTCASRLAATDLAALRGILQRLGDTRLAARSARIEARLPSEPPGEVLWQELLDGLGYAANREPMRALARHVPVGALESLLQALPATERIAAARGVLIGAAGFLPLSPSESHLVGLSSQAVSQLEEAWVAHGAPWHDGNVTPTGWNTTRVRPANHPLARLVSAAAVAANASQKGGLLASTLDLMASEGDPVAALRTLTATADSASIGADRARDIIASGVIPVTLAVAVHTGDRQLTDAASDHWERLPAPAVNAVTRRAAHQVAGATPLGRIGARGSQGLLHLDTVLCQPRRCFECPVAFAELAVKGD